MQTLGHMNENVKPEPTVSSPQDTGQVRKQTQGEEGEEEEEVTQR